MQLHTCERVTFIGVVLNILFTLVPEVSFTLVSVIDRPLACRQLQAKYSGT